MNFPFKKKTSPRRQAIREDMAEAASQRKSLRERIGPMLVITAVFALVAAVMQFWPGVPVPFREGERAPADLVSPVSFDFADPTLVKALRDEARAQSPPVLVRDDAELQYIEELLLTARDNLQQVRSAAQVKDQYPWLTDGQLAALHAMDDARFTQMVHSFVTHGLSDDVPLVSAEDAAILKTKQADNVRLVNAKLVPDGQGDPQMKQVFTVSDRGVDKAALEQLRKAASPVFSAIEGLDDFVAHVVLTAKIKPTYHYDARLSTDLAEKNADIRTESIPGATHIRRGEVIVYRGEVISSVAYQQLVAAQAKLETEIAHERPWAPWLARFGNIVLAILLTVVGALFVSRMTRGTISPQRAWSICGMLAIALFVARGMAAYAPSAMHLAGAAPTLLAAIILVIAFNPRFAIGLAALHGLLVTITLRQGIDFYLPMMAGVVVFCLGLREIRTRGKLIEVGAVASTMAFVTAWAMGFARMIGMAWNAGAGAVDFHAIWIDSLWAAGAGICVAMFALAILPSVERVFRITTAMTLLELCDANKPLLQRLSQEAPGTFNHSLTVGLMAEAAGNAIGANGLLCRVGAYYHDVGKLSKPQYFIENQRPGHANRHDKLSPAMSLLIIVGHVKDGIELAREYRLPWVVHQFIAQHHGTTLVEYFFHAARKRAEQDRGTAGTTVPEVSETEFRYPGPRPQTREGAIIMICDGCESIVRAIEEPTAGRIETAVHNLIMKRLMDGQFNECDLTLRELSVIEDTLVRTLAGIHHGRVAYPQENETRGVSDVGISQPA